MLEVMPSRIGSRQLDGDHTRCPRTARRRSSPEELGRRLNSLLVYCDLIARSGIYLENKLPPAVGALTARSHVV